MITKLIRFSLLAVFFILALNCSRKQPSQLSNDKTVVLSADVVMDKIKGGWVGQTVGVCYGGPTEFKYVGRRIPDSVTVEYNGELLERYFNNDDIYVELTFLSVLDQQGLDAPVDTMAVRFANAGYRLWHANQLGRLNILAGIMPPASGHWKNNPHADDIDFQIEADFIGLLTPGMPVTAYEYCDKVGHIMNYGDGFYGGVFVSALYCHAFFENDMETVVEKALLSLPGQSKYYQCIRDVLSWWKQWPGDWKRCWSEVQKKWSEDIGCPECVLAPGNIDAKLNGAYIAIGLLYGEKDFGRTIDIAMRCGQDSDCNPSNAGGVLGAMLGFAGIPEPWKVGLENIEDRKLDHCDYSLNDVYRVNYRLAKELVETNGGSVNENNWNIKVQEPKRPEKCEIGFEGLTPEKRIDFGGYKLVDVFKTTFEGKGFSIHHRMAGYKGRANCELWVDGKLIETYNHNGDLRYHRFAFFWYYDLEDGVHQLEIRKLSGDGTPQLYDLLVYR
jgi:ADP-ribosylglycohydrolase